MPVQLLLLQYFADILPTNSLAPPDTIRLFLGWHWFTHPKNPDTPLAVLIDHIEHMVEVAGIDHVGIGSDFDGGMKKPVIADVSQFVQITRGMMSRGLHEEEIKKIWGGNFLRVMKKAIDKPE